MYHLLLGVGKGMVSRDVIDATLTEYNLCRYEKPSKRYSHQYIH